MKHPMAAFGVFAGIVLSGLALTCGLPVPAGDASEETGELSRRGVGALGFVTAMAVTCGVGAPAIYFLAG